MQVYRLNAAKSDELIRRKSNSAEIRRTLFV